MNAQTALPNELQAIANKPKQRGRPVQLSGQVKPELKQFVVDALSQGFSKTDILNAALSALFLKKQEVK